MNRPLVAMRLGINTESSRMLSPCKEATHICPSPRQCVVTKHMLHDLFLPIYCQIEL